jgi:hypothetical protein
MRGYFFGEGADSLGKGRRNGFRIEKGFTNFMSDYGFI